MLFVRIPLELSRSKNTSAYPLFIKLFIPRQSGEMEIDMADKRDIVNRILRCPVCGECMSVTDDAKSAVCNGARKHCFDFSSQGYLSLSNAHSGGDSKQAVAARHDFLSSGYYAMAAQTICDTVGKYLPKSPVIIDAGCGEGYYTEKLAEISDVTLGFDLSKHGCLSASKQARKDGVCNVLYATASVFELPVKNGAADAVVNIFAPCAEMEYARVLRDGGYLFVVGAGKEHLMGLKCVLYSDVYENGERADLPRELEHIETVNVSYQTTVKGRAHIDALFSMTPYYWRTSEADKHKLGELSELVTAVEFEINIYRKK